MYSPGYVQSVARDSERGWTYVAGAFVSHLDGVQTTGQISRLNNAGFIDQSWRTNEDFRSDSVGQMMVTSGGVLLAMKAGRWMRALPDADGAFALHALNLPDDAANPFYALTRADDGYVYGVHNIYRMGVVAETWIRRLSPDGEYDSAWNMRLDSWPLIPLAIAVAPDGSISYIESRLGQSPITYNLVRRTSGGTLLWRRPITGEPTTIAVGSAGQTYIADSGSTISGRRGAVLRFRPDGEPDTQWIAPPDLVDPTIVTTRVIADRLLVYVRRNTGNEWHADVVAISTGDGSILGRDRLPVFSGYAAGTDGALVFTAGNAVSMFKFAPASGTTYQQHALVAEVGTPARISQIARWRDGFVVAGDFRYWYGGIRYERLMRLDANLKPDPDWRPELRADSQDRTILALTVDSRDGLIIGGLFKLGSKRNLVRFRADGAVDEAWSPNPDGEIYSVSAGSDGLLFVGGNFAEIAGTARRALARFSQSGAFDQEWAAGLTRVDEPISVAGVLDVGPGGVLVVWFKRVWVDGWPTNQVRTARLTRSGSGTELPLPASLSESPTIPIVRDSISDRVFSIQPVEGGWTPDPSNTRFALTRRLADTLEVDPTWPPLALPAYSQIIGVDGSHIYLNNADGGTVRVNKETAQFDSTWKVSQPSMQAIAPFPNSSAMLVSSYSRSPPFRTSLMVVDHSARPATPRTVVEYFATGNSHFFMTARPTEQAMLDSLPANFVRTGMQFAAVDGAVQPMIPGFSQPSPICRFYASPERGGSNTHFYGQQPDCQLLNTLAPLSNEGYDFAMLLPVNGTCQASAPTPVYRLFNDQSARNNGNHRYVVSSTRRAEMMARNWRDEGVAFCTTTATDSQPFGQW